MRARGFNILQLLARPAVFVLVLILLHALISEVSSGPHVCSDRLKNHFATNLTEFPMDPNEDINFLNYGDNCNLNSQHIFEKKLFQTYNSVVNSPADKSNEELITALDEVWNEFRKKTVDGALGDRICNPRRLLSCHPTIRQCVCRPDFLLEAPYTRDFHRGILVHSENVTTQNFGKDREETVMACRATSNCQWRAPWLGFCHLLCVKDHYCIGVDTPTSGVESESVERCVQCEPYVMKGLDKCTEEGARLSQQKKGPVHHHEEDESGSSFLNSKDGSFKCWSAIILMLISRALIF